MTERRIVVGDGQVNVYVEMLALGEIGVACGPRGETGIGAILTAGQAVNLAIALLSAAVETKELERGD